MVQGYRYIVVHTGTHEAVLDGTGVEVRSGSVHRFADHINDRGI